MSFFGVKVSILFEALASSLFFVHQKTGSKQYLLARLPGKFYMVSLKHIHEVCYYLPAEFACSNFRNFSVWSTNWYLHGHACNDSNNCNKSFLIVPVMILGLAVFNAAMQYKNIWNGNSINCVAC